MIVDDEPYNLIAIEGQLSLLGIKKLEKAFNGEDALNKIIQNNARLCSSSNHQPYKMIITDLQMPIMNGIKLTQAVKSL